MTIQRQLAYAWGAGTTLSLLPHSELHLPFKVFLPMVTVTERCQSQTVNGVMALEGADSLQLLMFGQSPGLRDRLTSLQLQRR